MTDPILGNFQKLYFMQKRLRWIFIFPFYFKSELLKISL